MCILWASLNSLLVLWAATLNLNDYLNETDTGQTFTESTLNYRRVGNSDKIVFFNWAIFLLQGTTVWGQFWGRVLMALNRQRPSSSTKHNLHSKEPRSSNIPKCRSLETQLPRYEGIWCHLSRVQFFRENDFVLPTSKMASDQSWTAPAGWIGPGSARTPPPGCRANGRRPVVERTTGWGWSGGQIQGAHTLNFSRGDIGLPESF